MKAAGVTTGMPIWEALPICPQVVYIKRDFQWYEVLSRQMLGIVQELSPRVEFYSIDEFFFTANDSALGSHVRQELSNRVGVPVSVGIAPTKTLAKLISDSVKPNGSGIVATDAERMQLLHGMPVTEVTGIAKRSAAKLAQYQITTCDQFAAASRRFIRWLLHKPGEDLWWELNGTAVKPILQSRPEHKFVSRGGSIGAASRDPARIQAFVVRNVERLCEALDHYCIVCDAIILELNFKAKPTNSARVSLISTADFEQLCRAALWLLPRVWQPPTAMIQQMHVIAARLRPRNQRQLSLFHEEKSRIQETARQINKDVGRFAIQSALTLPLADIRRDPANSYDICDIYGKTCF